MGLTTRSHGERGRERLETAHRPAQPVGRVGALGLLATAGLCVVVLSFASQMPPGPTDGHGVPGIAIGTPPGADSQPLIRQGGSAELLPQGGSDPADRRSKRAARQHDTTQAHAPGRAGDGVGPGDRGGSGPGKTRRGETPAAPDRDRGGHGNPTSGSPAGGQDAPPGAQNGPVMPPSVAAEPDNDDQEEAPEIDPEGDAISSPAASEPEDDPSDDPAPTGLSPSAPENDADTAETEPADP